MKIRTAHQTTIVSRCPHGGIDVYTAEFRVEDRILTVEAIQAEIDQAAQSPIYQEALTQRLADRLGCVVITTGTHGRFRTECRAEPSQEQNSSGAALGG